MHKNDQRDYISFFLFSSFESQLSRMNVILSSNALMASLLNINLLTLLALSLDRNDRKGRVGPQIDELLTKALISYQKISQQCFPHVHFILLSHSTHYDYDQNNTNFFLYMIIKME